MRKTRILSCQGSVEAIKGGLRIILSEHQEHKFRMPHDDPKIAGDTNLLTLSIWKWEENESGIGPGWACSGKQMIAVGLPIWTSQADRIKAVKEYMNRLYPIWESTKDVDAELGKLVKESHITFTQAAAKRSNTTINSNSLLQYQPTITRHPTNKTHCTYTTVEPEQNPTPSNPRLA
jgi:hypothetical protein